eukprot:TRINITY_DN3974_c0_g1_i10.p2 TRINITY_DN3974_c0_g1~~TRINITY_DN3974_c0_g1_i10.p2  ORF type:complete len:175 (-),score=72.58 TRINITY_DN3974_c0_g1_i10:1108-1632(-)
MGFTEMEMQAGGKYAHLESARVGMEEEEAAAAALGEARGLTRSQLLANVCFVTLLLTGVVCVGYGSYMLGFDNGVHTGGRRSYIVELGTLPEPSSDEYAQQNELCQSRQRKDDCVSTPGCGFCAWEVEGDAGSVCMPGDSYGPYDADQCCNAWYAFMERASDQCVNERRSFLAF